MSLRQGPIRVVGIGHATVIAYLALLIATGGAAVAATYVVSANSQIGPGTVSGSLPPSGRHDNVIANSLGGADINEAKLGTVPNANDLAGHPRSYYGHVVPLSWVGTVDTTQDLVNVDGLLIRAGCTIHAAPGFTAWVTFSASSAGAINDFYVADTSAYSGGTVVGPNGPTLTITSSSLDRPRVEGQAIYRRNSDGAVVTVAFHLFSDACEVFGTTTTTG